MQLFDAFLYWLTGLLPRKLIGFCALRVWTWASVERGPGKDGLNVTCADALATWDRRTGSKLGAAFAGISAALLVYLLVGLVAGCATVPASQPAVASVAVAPVETVAVAPVEQAWVRVKAGDTLWRLADERLGSPWYWPLIWKANRDFLAEPDWIDVGDYLNTPHAWQPGDDAWSYETAQGWRKGGYPRSIKKP
jgi:hypothetical protein